MPGENKQEIEVSPSAAAESSGQNGLTPTPLEAMSTEAVAVECAAGDPNVDSPLSSHQVYLTTSSDGQTFSSEHQLILTKASVPDGVVGPDGKLWVYFINGRPGQHGIFVAREGEQAEWEIVDCVRLDGQFEGNAVDPDIIRLADGRYRLVYYLGHFVDGPPPPDEPHPIYSAIAEDGLNFAIEQELIAVEGITDPTLTQLPDGSWLLAMAQNREERTLLATSEDGLNFTLTDNPVSAHGIPELAVLQDGRVHLYLSQHFVSEDNGQTWSVVTGVTTPGNGADPSLVTLSDGSYAFIYKGFLDQPGKPPPPSPASP